MTCSKCGNELKEGVKFCTKCGCKVKVKLDKLFITSVILMAVGIIGIIMIIMIPVRIDWNNPQLFLLDFLLFLRFIGYSSFLLFFSGITLAFISLYMKKGKLTMIVGITAYALIMLFFSSILVGGLINTFMSVAIILAFILLYNKKHKIILIAGLAVIALSFVLRLIYIFRYVW